MTELSKKNRWGDRVLLGLAILSFLGLGYGLFFFNPQLEVENKKPIGKLLTKGTVRRRHAGTLSWGNVRGEAPIYLRDIVYTPKEADAKIVFNNKKVLVLTPESMIQFDEVTSDHVEISLIEGEIKTSDQRDVRVTKKEVGALVSTTIRRDKVLTYLKDIEAFELHQTEISQRLKEKLGRSSELLKVKADLRPDSLLSRLDHYELKLVKPLPEKVFNLRANRWIELLWTPVPFENVDYTLEVSKEADFKRLLTHQTRNNKLALQFDDDARYFWRVRAVRNGEQIVSDVSTIVMSERGGEIAPFLDRLPTSRPKGYAVEISRDDRFERILGNFVAAEPKCSSADLKPGVYFCRVTSLTKSKKIKIYSFTVR